MKALLKEGYDSVNNQIEFYLVGLENFDDFDIVVGLLKYESQIKVIETVEGIYSRTLKFDIGDNHYKLIYSEDVGLYAFSLTQSDALNSLLRDKMQKIISDVQKMPNKEDAV